MHPSPPPRTLGFAPGTTASELLALQRSVGNRAVTKLLADGTVGTHTAAIQRAILAIDGTGDNDTAKLATANCLSNLQTVKSVLSDTGAKVPHKYPASDARGVTYGPSSPDEVRDEARVGIRDGEVDASESLYVLGHGDGKTIAGLAPTTLARVLNDAMADRPGKDPYTGKIKLIACYSASLSSDGAPINNEEGKPIKVPYAGQLASKLSVQKGRCRASAVEGIAGIAWVDEESGKKTGFDVLGDGGMNPLEMVYEDEELLPEWMAALTEPDPKERKRQMDEILDLVHEENRDFTGMRQRVTGKDARKVYKTRYLNRGLGAGWYGKEKKPG
jgi:hypothetical protein